LWLAGNVLSVQSQKYQRKAKRCVGTLREAEDQVVDPRAQKRLKAANTPLGRVHVTVLLVVIHPLAGRSERASVIYTLCGEGRDVLGRFPSRYEIVQAGALLKDPRRMQLRVERRDWD
jgi:hypothetical protein